MLFKRACACAGLRRWWNCRSHREDRHCAHRACQAHHPDAGGSRSRPLVVGAWEPERPCVLDSRMPTPRSSAEKCRATRASWTASCVCTGSRAWPPFGVAT
eukprot:scaffold462_cov195-Pinguiococcus_pyrenoidosus.AAC.21